MFNKNKTHIENKAFMVEPFRDPTANECNVVIANDICIRVTATCRILKAVFRRLPTGMKKRCRRRCQQITQKLSAGSS